MSTISSLTLAWVSVELPQVRFTIHLGCDCILCSFKQKSKILLKIIYNFGRLIQILKNPMASDY